MAAAGPVSTTATTTTETTIDPDSPGSWLTVLEWAAKDQERRYQTSSPLPDILCDLLTAWPHNPLTSLHEAASRIN